MERRRNRVGLSKAAAARRAGISQTRWIQVEQGYEKRGEVLIPTEPSKDLVIKVAAAFEDWDEAEALELAGYDPEYSREKPKDLPPSKLMDLWPKLTLPQKQVLENTARLFVDPHAAIDTSPSPVDARPRFTDASEPHITNSKSRH
jgi:DNA-binding XRE family transcriptional regulator